MISHQRLEAILRTLPRLTIGLVGDLFLDRYLELVSGSRELSIETGLEAYQIERVRNSPGALGTVLNNLAFAEDKTGNQADAITHYQQAVKLDPKYAKALNGLGYLYDKTGQAAQAVELLQQAVAIKPEYLAANYNLGKALFDAVAGGFVFNRGDGDNVDGFGKGVVATGDVVAASAEEHRGNKERKENQRAKIQACTSAARHLAAAKDHPRRD